MTKYRRITRRIMKRRRKTDTGCPASFGFTILMWVLVVLAFIALYFTSPRSHAAELPYGFSADQGRPSIDRMRTNMRGCLAQSESRESNCQAARERKLPRDQRLSPQDLKECGVEARDILTACIKQMIEVPCEPWADEIEEPTN